MNIVKKPNGTVLEMALDGRLDTTTAPALEEELKKGLDGVTELVLDLENLEYISSAGLRVLLMAKRILGGGDAIKVKNVNEIVQEVFDVTGFSDLLKII